MNKTALKKLAKILAILVIIAIVTFGVAISPIVDRVLFWCDYYPQSLADCRE